VKSLYSVKFQKGGRGLGRALKEQGLAFDGRPHSGKDDAINTARLLKHIIGE
jgi:inhibitor of KinA sporulation pathway (predicted exonuclease)